MTIPIRRYWSLLSVYLRPQRRRVAALGALLAGAIALELLNPLILRYFIDTARAGGAVSDLMRAALLFIAVALATEAFALAETYVAENVGWTATNSLRVDLARHLLGLDLTFHHAHTSGELIERVDGDVTLLANFFSRFTVQLAGNALLLLGVLAMLFAIDWRIGIAMTAFACLALYIMIRLRAVAEPHWAAVRQCSADFFGFVNEQLAGTEDVRALGATGYVMRRMTALLRAWLPIQRRAGLIGSAPSSASLLLFSIGTALSFGVGAALYAAGAISLGTVYLIFQYSELIRRPTEGLRTQLQDLQQAGASIGRIEELLRVRTKIVDGAGTPLPPGAVSVTFDGVSFAYHADDEGEMVLRDVDFRLAPGTVLGLLGHTGSGKTTLTRLLPRFYDPTQGAVRLGDVDLREARVADVRRRVGMVPQEVQLFAATVRENLTLFDESVPDARVLETLHELGLGSWYRTLPDGLATVLAAGNAGLSAGEAQLLAFARVFLGDPGVVILDEASSRLDPATERLITRATEKLLRGRTSIIVAHRLSTVRQAGQIMILERGAIVEYGRRDDLEGDPDSRFSALLRTGLEVALA